VAGAAALENRRYRVHRNLSMSASFTLWCGQAVRGRIGPATLRRWFFYLLFICLPGLGIQITARAFV
jgi:hypothetical protein